VFMCVYKRGVRVCGMQCVCVCGLCLWGAVCVYVCACVCVCSIVHGCVWLCVCV